LSDGQLEAVVIDPSKITGRDYRVSFAADAAANQVVWNLDRIDQEGPVRVLSNQSNQAGDDAYSVVDGLLVKVAGPPNNFKNFEVVANASGPLDPPEGGAADFAGFPSVEPTDGQQAGPAVWLIHTADVATGSGYETFLGRVTNDGARWSNIIPQDFEIRFTAAGGWAYDPFQTGRVFKVPFELWNIGIGTPDDPSDDYRMVPYVLDDDTSGTFNMAAPGTRTNGSDEHSISSGANDPYTDWIYWATPDDKTPGEAGYKAWEAAALALPGLQDDGSFYNVMATDDAIRRMVLVNWNGGEAPPYNQDLPEVGTIFRLTTTKPNSAADVFTFKTSDYQAVSTLAEAKAAAQLVNIFPNPYFGQNRAEVNPVTRFVTLTHLPTEGATIRIFSLGGDLIKTIDDRIRSQQGTLGTQTALWDLRNDNDIPVASGMYLIHVRMPNLGDKVLKLAVFMPEERLDKF
jgi:hypothetical protein